MTKTLKQKITSKDAIGILSSLERDKITEGVHYADSGFKGKNKDGFWGTNHNPETIIKYIQNNYPNSMGKHKVKYNSKKDINKHKIELKNKYDNSLEIEFSDM